MLLSRVPRTRGRRPRAGRVLGDRRSVMPVALALIGLMCAAPLAGCGDTLQSRPVTGAQLEPLVSAQHYPIYWLGTNFHGMQLTGASSDPTGAYTVQYGNCITGGPETCVPPLTLISSPDNSFLPGAEGRVRTVSIRGVRAVVFEGGAVIEIATGPAVIDVRARSSALALTAARQMVPINELGLPGAPLPRALPDTGFAARPMEGQRSSALLVPPVAKR